MQTVVAPQVVVVAREGAGRSLAAASPRRTYDIGPSLREVLFQLRSTTVSGDIAIECVAVGEDPPELRLEAEDIAALADARANLMIALQPNESHGRTAAESGDSVRVLLAVTGTHITPAEVVEILELAATEQHDSQTRIARGRRKDLPAIWACEIGAASPGSLNPMIVRALSDLMPRAARLAQFAAEREARVTVELVSKLLDARQRLVLEWPTLELLRRFHAGLWYDPLIET